MVQVSAKEITNLYLYGQPTTPSNLEDDSLIRDSTVPNTIKEIDTSEFMETGPGRFAVGSQFELVQKFFDPDFAVTSETDTEDKTYTKEELAKEFGLSDSYGWSMKQYHFVDSDENNEDYIERSYIWNSMSFQISDSAQFIVTPDGDKFIKDFGVEPRDRKKLDKKVTPDENFDFVGGGRIAELSNAYLEPRIDPSKIGRTVDIEFIKRDKLKKRTYTLSDYNADQKRSSEWDINIILAGTKLLLGRKTFIQNLGIKFLDSRNRYIVYGTAENDSMKHDIVKITHTVYPYEYVSPNDSGTPFDNTNYNPFEDPFDYRGLVFITGTGADKILGGRFDDKLDGGDGNDTLDGGEGNDVFIGSKGNDKIEGNSGTDSSMYEGTVDEYDIEFLADDSVKITDRVGDRDGSDLLKGVEQAVFSDKTIDLSPGQDIAFVIDTTTSMGDDIDAVRARSSEIINTIFDSDRGFLDSQIAVVGYNNYGAGTYLSFTEQPKIEDRKNAAIKAINSISLKGGIERMNAGLIEVLSGGAGEWRKEADVRRIILFGDEPPDDPELRSEVLKLAANVGINIPNRRALSITGDIETSSITSDLSITRFALATENSDGTTVAIPVEIFSILMGNDSSTEADFQSLADATGGKLFNADNASQVVDVILKAIETPIDDNQAPTALKLDNKTIDENVAPQSLVGNFSTTDLDSGNNFTYELVTGDGDTDNKYPLSKLG